MSKVPINFRIEPELKAALEKTARDSGRSPSEMYRDVAWACVRAPHSTSTATGGETLGYTTQTAQEPSIDLATWLSQATGIPRAVARSKIKMGHVAVSGEIHRDPTVDAARLVDVALDGVRVKAGG